MRARSHGSRGLRTSPVGREEKPLQPRAPKPPRASSGLPHPRRRAALPGPGRPAPLLPAAALAGRLPRPAQQLYSSRGATLARRGRSGRPGRTRVSGSRLPLSLSRPRPPARAAAAPLGRPESRALGCRCQRPPLPSAARPPGARPTSDPLSPSRCPDPLCASPSRGDARTHTPTQKTKPAGARVCLCSRQSDLHRAVTRFRPQSPHLFSPHGHRPGCT